MTSENGFQHLHFGLVSDGSAGGMGVDIIDLAGIETRIIERLAHGSYGCFGMWARNDHVIRIARGAAAGDLSVSVRGTGACVLCTLQDEHHASLTDNEAIAVDIEWA